jgi:HAMP domain-containing protein
MGEVESLLAHRIKQSSALIARIRPLVETAMAAAKKREIGDPVVALADSMRWRRRLIAALDELNDCADKMARIDPAATPAGERQMLCTLRTEISNLIDTIAQLTKALMPRQPSRPLPR